MELSTYLESIEEFNKNRTNSIRVDLDELIDFLYTEIDRDNLITSVCFERVILPRCTYVFGHWINPDDYDTVMKYVCKTYKQRFIYKSLKHFYRKVKYGLRLHNIVKGWYHVAGLDEYKGKKRYIVHTQFLGIKITLFYKNHTGLFYDF
jgi:hypothetical protein